MCDLKKKLDSLSNAEEIFDFLDVSYDHSIINNNRLNILKRFNQYLRNYDLEEFNEYEQRHLCRAQLSRAYNKYTRLILAKENVPKAT